MFILVYIHFDIARVKVPGLCRFDSPTRDLVFSFERKLNYAIRV